MAEFQQVMVQEPVSLERDAPGLLSPFLVAQAGYSSRDFEGLYVPRNIEGAPPLSQRFDETAATIYWGLDPKAVYFPQKAQHDHYPDAPAEELAAVSDALNSHGRESLALARRVFGLRNVEWLGLASKAGVAVIHSAATYSASELVKREDELGYIRRIPQTDVGVVGPRRDADSEVSLAMGVADCLAVSVVDERTKAFGFVHAGRQGTALRTVERATDVLRDSFRSVPGDLVAFLGEGVCQACYTLDQKGLDGFTRDFGGRPEIDKVIAQYPSALQPVKIGGQERVGLDLYAFNKYLLAAQGVGEIVVAANCTARTDVACMSLDESVPLEGDQEFYSHVRANGKLVEWTMRDGQQLALNTAHLGTPRNLAVITRF